MSIDFLIIGGGPAGMAAALQASRLNLSTTIIEKDCLGGQALAAPWIENYLGFPEGISGRDLMQIFERHIINSSIPVIYEETIDIERKGHGFIVHTQGVSLSAKTLLLAVGLTPRLAGLPNEIPYGNPHKIEHEGKDVLVVGSGDSAFDLASSFAMEANKVIVAIRGEKPKAIPIIVERALLRGVHIETNWEPSKIHADIIISCVGKEMRHPLMEKLKERFGPFEIKPHSVQSIPGLFLAGDLCRGNDRHIAIAVGDGIAATQAAKRFLGQG